MNTWPDLVWAWEDKSLTRGIFLRNSTLIHVLLIKEENIFKMFPVY